jgi:hypothetical protein
MRCRWAFSTLLSSSDCSNHNCYNPNASTAYSVMSGETWKITYADESGASGIVGTDTVTIGNTTLLNHPIELANKVSSSFVSDSSDGLVGMSFSSLNTVTPDQQKVWWETASSSWDSALFAAYLPNSADGSFDFGFIDETKYTGDVVYTDVDTSYGFWEFDCNSYKVGNTSYTSEGTSCIADTGTTLILMVDEVVDNYYSAVSSASYSSTEGGYTYDCDATLPDFQIQLGDTHYVNIPGSLMNYTKDGSSCYGSLQSVGDSRMQVLGDSFFNAIYAVFDTTKPSFGWAPSIALGGVATSESASNSSSEYMNSASASSSYVATPATTLATVATAATAAAATADATTAADATGTADAPVTTITITASGSDSGSDGGFGFGGSDSSSSGLFGDAVSSSSSASSTDSSSDSSDSSDSLDSASIFDIISSFFGSS